MPQATTKVLNGADTIVPEAEEPSLEELMRNVEEAQKELSRVVLHEHIAVYREVNGLIKDMRRNTPTTIKEDEYIPQITGCTDKAITHILHVQNEDSFFKDYYKKFIISPTKEFEVRFNYVDALVQLAIALNAFRGSKVFEDSKVGIEDEWKKTKTIVQYARMMARGKPDAYNGCIESSYQTLKKFRNMLERRYHEVDRIPFRYWSKQ